MTEHVTPGMSICRVLFLWIKRVVASDLMENILRAAAGNDGKYSWGGEAELR